MKIDEIRNLPDDELTMEVTKARRKIFKMSFKDKGSSIESPGALKLLKKDIARLLTVIRERETARRKKSS